MKKLIAIAALAISANVTAAPAVMVGGWSKHLVTDGEFNSNHQMLVVEHDRWIAGRFINSYGEPSLIAAYGYTRQWGDIRAAVHVGVVHGYEWCRLCPVAVPSLTYTRYPVQPAVMLMGEALVGAVRLQF